MESLIETFIQALREDEFAPSTINQHGRNLHDWSAWITQTDDVHHPSAWSSQMIDCFLNTYRGQGRTRHQASLRCFREWLTTEYYIDG